MNQGFKTLLWLVGLGAAGFVILKYAKKMYLTPRERAILDIELTKYSGFEEPFLVAWSEAKKQNQADFQFQNKIYLTATGRAKK